jgi:hypothetical protein
MSFSERDSEQFKLTLQKKFDDQLEEGQLKMSDIVRLSAQALEEVTKKSLNEAQRKRLARLVKEKIDHYKAQEEIEEIHPDSLLILIKNVATPFVRSLVPKTRPPPVVALDPDLERSTRKDAPKSRPTLDYDQEIPDIDAPVYQAPESDLYTDKNDPAKRTIDYKGRNLTLKPKKGSYEKWHNVIRFNAPTHFRDRYLKAYAYHADEEKTKGSDATEADIDRLARSTVYKTLTGNQLEDYVNRVRYYNRSRPKVCPKETGDPFSWTKSSVWQERAKVFDHSLPVPEDTSDGRSSNDERPTGRDEVGADLLPDDWRRLSKEEYLQLRAEIRKKILEKRPETVSDYDIGDIKVSEKRAASLKKKKVEEIDDLIDQHIMKHHLKYALDKPSKQWQKLFTQSKVHHHYPHRYQAVVQEDGYTDLFKQSSKIRSETYRAFNQRQLNDWKERVTQETQLMGNDSYLPEKGELRVSPQFDPENRSRRIEQFLRYRKTAKKGEPKTPAEPQKRAGPAPKRAQPDELVATSDSDSGAAAGEDRARPAPKRAQPDELVATSDSDSGSVAGEDWARPAPKRAQPDELVATSDSDSGSVAGEDDGKPGPTATSDGTDEGEGEPKPTPGRAQPPELVATGDGDSTDTPVGKDEPSSVGDASATGDGQDDETIADDDEIF